MNQAVELLRKIQASTSLPTTAFTNSATNIPPSKLTPEQERKVLEVLRKTRPSGGTNNAGAIAAVAVAPAGESAGAKKHENDNDLNWQVKQAPESPDQAAARAAALQQALAEVQRMTAERKAASNQGAAELPPPTEAEVKAGLERKKEIERIEAAILRATEERKRQVAQEAISAPVQAPVALASSTEVTAPPAGLKPAPLVAPASTSDSEAKARALLNAKVAEVTGRTPQPSALNSTAATPPLTRSPAPVTPPPITPIHPSPFVEAPVRLPAPNASQRADLTPEAEAKARALLDSKIAEITRKTPASVVPVMAPSVKPVAVPPPPVISPAPPPVVITPAPKPAASAPVVPPQEDKASQKARAEQEKRDQEAAKAAARQEARRKKEAEEAAAKAAREEARRKAAAEEAAKTAARARQKEAAEARKKEKGSIETPQPAKAAAQPSTPASSSESSAMTPKQRKLAELLKAYKREKDPISAAEYHRERAKILAEP